MSTPDPIKQAALKDLNAGKSWLATHRTCMIAIVAAFLLGFVAGKL